MNTNRRVSNSGGGGGGRRNSSNPNQQQNNNNSSDDDDNNNNDGRLGTRRGTTNPSGVRRSSNPVDDEIIFGDQQQQQQHNGTGSGGNAAAVSNAANALASLPAGAMRGVTNVTRGAVSNVGNVTRGAVSNVGNVTRGAVSNVGKAFTSLRRGAAGGLGNRTDSDEDNNNMVVTGGGKGGRRLFGKTGDNSKSTHHSRRTKNNTSGDEDDMDPDYDDEEEDEDEEGNDRFTRESNMDHNGTGTTMENNHNKMNDVNNNNNNNNKMSSSTKISDTFNRRRGGGNNNNNNNNRGGPGGGGGGDTNILDKLPTEYRYHPRTATPMLHYLPRLMASVAARRAAENNNNNNNNNSNNNNNHEAIPLRSLLKAAQGDIRLHRARVQASLKRDMKLIRTYQLDHDPRYKERCQRLQERKEMVTELRNEKDQILKDLKDGVNDRISGLTQAESSQLQLARWQRALELYVYDTAAHDEQNNDDNDHDYYFHNRTLTTNNNNNNNNNSNKHHDSDLLNWQSVFEKLLDGISEDQDISQILVQASEMCMKLVRETEKNVDDTAQYLADLESGYVIRLEAHEMFARSCYQQVNQIEEQFRTAGQAALRIGHQLENAELKRSQCEAASILIRRWWIMESLAEQEASSGEYIPVEMEMNGGITPNACRLDHLFTKRENSLEASKALKQLRAVVRSRGNAAAGGTSSAGTAMIIDKSGSKRLDLTSDLISRVSDALEERLLNQFSIIYNAGGNYDFGLKPRPGGIDWRELRSLAQALLLFDSGRNLHKRYVEMVLENRFPELFVDQKNKSKEQKEEERVIESMKDANLNTFDMDATRTSLSTLFHRVSEVCTAEFELIAHVFSSAEGSRTDLLDGSEEMPLVVARALLQRVISDPQHGLQSRVNDLLASIDRQGDFDSGAKKLDTFVIIHEKAASLFRALRDAADRMILTPDETTGTVVAAAAAAVAAAAAAAGGGTNVSSDSTAASALNAVESLKGFLTSQELALGNQHRQSYINLELRLLHHDCCACLDQAGCTLVKAPAPRPDNTLAEKGILEEYRAPVLPLHKTSLEKMGFAGVLTKPLKPAVLRQPLIHGSNALSRARLMFGTSLRGGETTARVILSIYNQMCCFYGEAFLFPIMETLREMIPNHPPNQPPPLPFNEEEDAHDLGVSPAFWVALERIHSAAKSFDRELWGIEGGSSGSGSGGTGGIGGTKKNNMNNNNNSNKRVYQTLEECGDPLSMNFARNERTMFYSELERRGESGILRALDAISSHVQWILVSGGESMLATGASRMLGSLTGGTAGGPYAIPAGSSLDTPNSPAVKALAYCLRVQFVHIQAALTPSSLSNFWTALSMRLYDILVARLLQHYLISTVGAVILSRDVDALRSVAMLAGTEHGHWDLLRELLTLYMTPPDAIRGLLTGPGDGTTGSGVVVGTTGSGVGTGGSGSGSGSIGGPGSSSSNDLGGKTSSTSSKTGGLFAKAGKDRCLVFLSRRNDYRYKTTSGLKKSVWIIELLNDLKVTDPTDTKINIGLFAAGRNI